MNKHCLRWVGVAIVTVIAFGTFGAALLTAQRQQVDAPLVASSEDIANELEGGANLNVVSDASNVNMNKSMAPFTVIYTRQGQPVAGSGRLNGSLPNVPVGVLTSSNGKEYSIVTWQPQGSLRYDAVTVSAGNYYVLSGQSLHFAEHSAQLTEVIVGLGCIASLIVIAGLYWLTRSKK